MTHEELESIKKLVGSAFADGYQIISVLGTGGSSIVYRARYEPLDRDVALKLLRVDEKSGADVVRLLKTEARNASRLQHPNIVPVLRINTADDGTPFLVTEFADGVSLADLLQQRGGRLNETEFFKVFDDIMDGLEYAHSNNVVHCDLKPSNIIVRLDGNDIVQARILDFGISRIVSQHATNSSETASGIFGTPAYMSPEQCLGKKPDKRTDIYSLGCMMYEAVSGRKVFEGESAFQIIHEHTSTPPTPFAKLHKPVQVGSRIENGIMAALRKERSERPQSVAELRSILHGETTYVRPGSFSPVGRTRVSRKGLLAVATAATILAVCAAVFLKVNNAETDGGAGGGDRGGDSAAAGYNGGYSAAGGYNGGYNGGDSGGDAGDGAENAKIIESMPSDAKSAFGRGEEYQRVHNPQKAIELFQLADKMASQRPGTAKDAIAFRFRIKQNLAFELNKLQKFGESDQVLMEAVPLVKSLDVPDKLALSMQQSGNAIAQNRPQQAIDYAQQGVDVTEANVKAAHGEELLQAHYNASVARGVLAVRLGEAQRYKEAEKQWYIAISHDAFHLYDKLRLENYFRLAQLQDKVGRTESAVHTMEKYDLLARNSRIGSAVSASDVGFGYESYADYLSKIGRFADADAMFDTAIRYTRGAGNSWANYDIGIKLYKRARNYYLMGKVKEGEETYEECEKFLSTLTPEQLGKSPVTLQGRRDEISRLRRLALTAK